MFMFTSKKGIRLMAKLTYAFVSFSQYYTKCGQLGRVPIRKRVSFDLKKKKPVELKFV